MSPRRLQETVHRVSPVRPQEAPGNGPPDDCPPGDGLSSGRLCLPQQHIYHCSVILDLFLYGACNI